MRLSTQKCLFRALTSLLVIAAVALQQGCGGGGSSKPLAPTLGLSVQATKTFHFSWKDVSGESEYRLMENPDGASGFRQVATLAAGSTQYDLTVSLPQRINARYLLQACNKKGCTDSKEVAVSGTLADGIGYFKASNAEASDYFGFSTALSSDGATLAVGAPGEASSVMDINGNQADNSAKGSGAVYLFRKSTGVWIQEAYIKASNTGANDDFGGSVALSADGSRLAVGAANEGSSATGMNGNQADNTAANSGAVYVFGHTSSGWAQEAYIKASNTEVDDYFGSSVALSPDGSTLAVGAPYEDSSATGINGNQSDNSAIDSGAVYLFRNSGGNWAQQAYLKASNTDAGDIYGVSLALSADGNILAVGALREDGNAAGIGGNQADNSASNSGAAYLYGYSKSGWAQQAYIKASNAEAGDYFGGNVALSADGSTFAVTAWLEASNASGVNGAQSDNSARASGAVYLFQNSGGTWAQQAYLKASNTESGDFFGSSVALSADGSTLAVSATHEGGSLAGINGDQADNSAALSGAIYMFSSTSGGWLQQAYVKSSNPGGSDDFGFSVALSADGSTLAVGTDYEDSGATGINGAAADNSVADSGAVYLY